MLVLIAESKTMAPCAESIRPLGYEAHAPAFASRADSIMEAAGKMSVDELAGKVKISVPMARKLHQMAYDFPHKESGCKAIEAFTGVVFKSFGYKSLSESEQNTADGCVGIISSLYGWLRPDDVVKPYRLDFTTPMTPDGETLANYWRESVTGEIAKRLAETNDSDVLNLLPGDAAKCIDWKKIEQKAKVWKAEFYEVRPGGELRTPNSNKLKMLRGELLRHIVTDKLISPEDLKGIVSDNFMPEPSEIPGKLIFVTA